MEQCVIQKNRLKISLKLIKKNVARGGGVHKKSNSDSKQDVDQRKNIAIKKWT